MAKLFDFVEFKRDQVVRFRATAVEKEFIEQMAKDCGMSVSDFCRKQAMSRRFRSRVAASVINELVALNLELKAHRDNLEDLPEYRLILAQVAEAIERIPADAQMEDF